MRHHLPGFFTSLIAGALLAPAAHAEPSTWNPFEGRTMRSQPLAATPAGPGGQIPATTLATKAPAFLDGGGRPSISASAPPVVAFTGHPARSIVIDHSARALYYVISSTSAYRYPISVGREGFGWTGTQTISRVADWPDWRPPAEMRQRDPNLPIVMGGGVRNPLGAKALYLGSSLYRIHGTNDARSIGYAASSGCFRMMNSHVLHLASMAGVGTMVRVVDRLPRNVAGGSGKPAG